MKIVHYYRRTEAPHGLLPSVREALSQDASARDDPARVLSVDTESCFNVQLDGELDGPSAARLEWLLRETFDRDGLRREASALGDPGAHSVVLEFGPRMTFTSAFSSNATSICAACGLTAVARLERSRRYKFEFSAAPSDAALGALRRMLHDRMTEEEYLEPIRSFESGAAVEPVVWVPIMEEGRKALEKINDERGLGFDEFDLDFYTQLFKVSAGCIVMCAFTLL